MLKLLMSKKLSAIYVAMNFPEKGVMRKFLVLILICGQFV